MPRITSARLKQSAEAFAEKAAIVHANKYSYAEVDYKGQYEKVKIICPIHGGYLQIPKNHLRGTGCRRCAGRERASRQEWIDRFTARHGNAYDYSLLPEEIDCRERLPVCCPEHGVFQVYPTNHTKGSQCPRCHKLVTHEDWIQLVKKLYPTLDFSRAIYTANRELVTVVCPQHGVFKVQAGELTRARTRERETRLAGCPGCRFGLRKDTTTITREEWIERYRIHHGDKYDYSKLPEFISYKQKISIVCPMHGVFKMLPHNHYKKGKCPKCVHEEAGPGHSASQWAACQKGRKATLYVVRMYSDEESFFKVGITFNSVRRRFETKTPYTVQTIAEYKSDSAKAVWHLELKIKNALKKYKHRPAQPFPGQHECFATILNTLSVILPDVVKQHGGRLMLNKPRQAALSLTA